MARYRSAVSAAYEMEFGNKGAAILVPSTILHLWVVGRYSSLDGTRKRRKSKAYHGERVVYTCIPILVNRVRSKLLASSMMIPISGSD
ncbi:hypothetical protein KC351_g43 [Hortaea werneckii]|nr:hypothetical protein KC351_g43 [Hortaea werneckii]